MYRSILAASIFLAAGFSAFARAASFIPVSGNLDAEAYATPATTLGPTVYNTPFDASLTLLTPTASVSATASTNYNPGSYADGYGSFNAWGSFSSTSIQFELDGSSRGSIGQPALYGSGGGSGSADLFFTLSAPSMVRIENIPEGSGYYDSGTSELLKSGSLVNSFTHTEQDFSELLAAGSYELKGADSVYPFAGTGGGGGLEMILTIVPEPASCMLLAAPLLICMRRRRAS